ncbi:hypothetical protein OSTOST_04773 [Ostertagia ostertagi]
MKEILAMELARGALSSARRMITCFLYRDEISAVFGYRQSTQYTSRTPYPGDFETISTESTNGWGFTSTALPWWSRKVNQNKDDGEKEDAQNGNE